jgi:tol-pal system protein YbgF
MKTLERISLFAGIVIVGMLMVGGCASTGTQAYQSSSNNDEDAADIDALLGLNDNSDDNIGEDDVLRLLGVAEEKPVESAIKPAEESGSDISWATPSQSSETMSQSDASSQGAGTTSMAYRETEKKPSSQTIQPPARSTSAALFEQQYDEARRAYNARDFKRAVQQFEALLIENRNHSLADNCQYWIGESYYGMGNYEQAIAAFEKVFTFSNSNKYADSQLKLGLSYMRMSNTARAAQEFQKLIDNYPTSEYVSVAKQYLVKLNAGDAS